MDLFPDADETTPICSFYEFPTQSSFAEKSDGDEEENSVLEPEPEKKKDRAVLTLQASKKPPTWTEVSKSISDFDIPECRYDSVVLSKKADVTTKGTVRATLYDCPSKSRIFKPSKLEAGGSNSLGLETPQSFPRAWVIRVWMI